MTTILLAAALPAVIVEASRLEKTEADIPAAVEVVKAGEIAASGAGDLGEALERSSSALTVTRTGAGNPALAQIAMPGWGENGFGRVLVAVDGVKLNQADMSAPLLSQIDLYSARKVEILHGSAAVLHGDNASAGMINVVTEPEGYENRGRVEVRGGSFDTYGARASYSGGDEEAKVKYWADGGWEHSRGYRHNNGWELWNVRAGVRKDFENGSFAKFSAFWNEADYDLAGYLEAGAWKHSPRAALTPEDRYRRRNWGANSTIEGVIGEHNRVRLDLAFTGSAMDSFNHSEAPGVYTDDYRMEYDLYSFEITPQWINESELFSLENELILGATWRYDRLHGASSDRMVYMGSPSSTRTKYEYNRESMAFFAQDTLHLTESLAVEAGARYQRTWSENTALASPRRISDTYAADAALLFTPIEGLKTYLRFSRYFRNPFLDENPYRNYVAQEILSPETGWRVDLGADWTFADEFRIFANVFASRTKNEIFYDPFYLGTNANSPSPVIREGFTLGGKWEKEKVAGAALAYTFAKAEFDGGVYDGNEVPMAPESTIVASGRVWLWDECFIFGGWRYLSDRRAYSDFSNSSSRLASAGVFHLGASYAPEWGWLKGLKFGVTVDNILDRRYADLAVRGSGRTVYYPAAGRSVMFTVSYEF